MFAGSISQLADLKQRQSLADQQMAAQGMQSALAILMAEKQRRAVTSERSTEFDRTLALRKDEAALDRASRSQEFEANEAYRRDALRQADRFRRRDLLLRSRDRSEALAQRERAELLPEINQWISEGGGAGPEVTEDDFKSSFPKASWSYAPMATKSALKAREALKALYHQDLADADALNTHSRNQNMIDQEGRNSWDPDEAPLERWGPDRSNTPDKVAIGEWTGAANNLGPIVTAIRSDKNRVGRLQPTTSGMYEAVAPGFLREQPNVPGIPAASATAVPGREKTATNPATGEKLVLRNGRWAPYTNAVPAGPLTNAALTNQTFSKPVLQDGTATETNSWRDAIDPTARRWADVPGFIEDEPPSGFIEPRQSQPDVIRDAPHFPFLSPTTNAALTAWSKIKDPPPAGFTWSNIQDPPPAGAVENAGEMASSNRSKIQENNRIQAQLINELKALEEEQNKPIPRVQLTEDEQDQLRAELDMLLKEAKQRGIKIR